MVTHLKVVATAVLVAAFAFQASAVDFKIDLPPGMGVSPGAEPSIDLPDFPDDLLLNEEEGSNRTERTSASPLSSKEGLRAWEKPRGMADYEKGSCPMLSCLADNVAFWESVYRDIETSSVIFHDRQNLGRVYGVANLPNSVALRRSSSELYKSYFAGKLRELADNLQFPQRWDSAQRDLAISFVGRDRNPETIRRAANNIRLQSGLKGHFEDGIQRSLAYLPTVQRIVEQEGLPPEIMLLPHVESGYHPRAMSKVGAAGLWQLMPDTMRLLLGRSYVGRRMEVEPATRAAVKLLRQNYGATQSWPLALTAYNHGLNGVLKAVKKTGSRDLCTIIERYDSPSFRFASSNFYAQFLAARKVSLARYAEIARTTDGGKVLRPLLATTGGGRL